MRRRSVAVVTLIALAAARTAEADEDREVNVKVILESIPTSTSNDIDLFVGTYDHDEKRLDVSLGAIPAHFVKLDKKKKTQELKLNLRPGKSPDLYAITLYTYKGSSTKSAGYTHPCRLHGKSGSFVTLVCAAKPRYALDVKTWIETTEIRLDKRLKHVEVKESAPFIVPKGGRKRKREDYTIKQSLTLQQSNKGEAETRLNLPVVEVSIKGALERSTSRTFEESKTTSDEVEIEGGDKPVVIVWIEQRRTGKAVTFIDAARHEIAFEYPDGWTLNWRPAKEPTN